MPGRTPAEAVNALVESLGRAISCITNAVLNVRGGYYPSRDPHSLTLADGSPVRVANDLLMVLDLRYRIAEDVRLPGPWRVGVVAYTYTLANAADQEIISYQWHPAGASPITYPHLHLGPATGISDQRVSQAHLPTGHIR